MVSGVRVADDVNAEKFLDLIVRLNFFSLTRRGGFFDRRFILFYFRLFHISFHFDTKSHFGLKMEILLFTFIFSLVRRQPFALLLMI